MDIQDIETIIRRATVCRLGLIDGEAPYVVPLCFGYRNGSFYFHTSPKSRKLEMIQKHPRVCLEMDVGTEPLAADTPCDWNMRYASVIAFGMAAIVEDASEKREALAAIMDQYTGGPYDFPEEKLAITAVIKVMVERMTGRRSKIGAASRTRIS